MLPAKYNQSDLWCSIIRQWQPGHTTTLAVDQAPQHIHPFIGQPITPWNSNITCSAAIFLRRAARFWNLNHDQGGWDGVAPECSKFLYTTRNSSTRAVANQCYSVGTTANMSASCIGERLRLYTNLLCLVLEFLAPLGTSY